MTELDRYQCDFCGNAYNKQPAGEHTIDGEQCEVCEECEREFQRVTDFPDGAWENGYQYNGIYFPKSLSGEGVRRHFWKVQEDFNGLAEWCLVDKLLMAFHKDRVSQTHDEYETGSWESYNEYTDMIEQEVRADDSFNRER